MHTYLAYGFSIGSERALPELRATDKVPEVHIRNGKVDRTAPPDACRGQTFWATRDKMCIAHDEVGALLIQNGNEIVVDPAPGVEDRVLRLQILGPALAVILHQKGLLVLHASAVANDDGALAFLGAQEWGKSTTAALFHSKGYSLVADDYVAVDALEPGAPYVQPGFPQMKLWPDAAKTLGEAIEMMPLLHPQLEKRGHRIARGFQDGPVPLKRLYVLAEGERQAIEPLTQQEALVELVRHSYAVRLLEATQTRATHFRQCSGVVTAIPVRRLKRPRDLAVLPELARLVEEDLGKSGQQA